MCVESSLPNPSQIAEAADYSNLRSRRDRSAGVRPQRAASLSNGRRGRARGTRLPGVEVAGEHRVVAVEQVLGNDGLRRHTAQLVQIRQRLAQILELGSEFLLQLIGRTAGIVTHLPQRPRDHCTAPGSRSGPRITSAATSSTIISPQPTLPNTPPEYARWLQDPVRNLCARCSRRKAPNSGHNNAITDAVQTLVAHDGQGHYGSDDSGLRGPPRAKTHAGVPSVSASGRRSNRARVRQLSRARKTTQPARAHRRQSDPSVTVTSTGRPSRISVTGTAAPISCDCTATTNSSASVTSRSPTFTITSPSTIPAC